MASYTRPPEFDEEVNKWPAYQVQLEAFFKDNGVTDEKKHASLVAVLSTNTVVVICGRSARTKVNELPYIVVIALLEQHFLPKLKLKLPSPTSSSRTTSWRENLRRTWSWPFVK